jgi:hypothetical protein
VVLYAVFRFRVIAPVSMPGAYTPQLGSNLWRTPLAQLGDLLGAGVAAGVVAAAALGLAAGLVAGARGRAALAGLARPAAFAAGWTAASLAPFVLLAAPQPRHAMIAEAPACLLLAALLEGAWRAWGAARPRAFEALLLAGLALAVPWPLLRERAIHPFGAPARALVAWIDAQQPPLSPRATIVVLFGAPGLASREEGDHFRYLLYGGGALNAVHPKLLRVMRFADLSQRPARSAMRPGSAVLVLRPGMSFEPAPADLLDRELWRRFDAEPASEAARPAQRVVPTETGR